MVDERSPSVETPKGPFCATSAAQVFHVVSGSDLMLKGKLGPKVVVIMVVFQSTGKWFRSRSRCQRDVVHTYACVYAWPPSTLP